MSDHPNHHPAVLLARVRAMIPWCATAPSADALAKEIDTLYGPVSHHDAACAAMENGMSGSAYDMLCDMEFDARESCGAEPYIDQVQVRCAVRGIYMDERGKEAAWELWSEAVDLAQAQAGREFRAKMAVMLRAVELALLAGDVVERRAA